MFLHPHAFDPTYGYDLDRLLSLRAGPTPAGFEAFWRQTYERARGTAARARLTPSADVVRQRRVFDVEFDGADGFRVGGWLTIPANGRVTCGFVYGHGYGGRTSAEVFLPVESAAVILPCARGFHRSARPGLPDTGARHVVYGIESIETYLHRACVSDFWSATTALIDLVPEVGETIFYCGESFGGGIGALALPWEPRWAAGFLDFPSFGNQQLRVTIPCAGSGESVRQHVMNHPEALDVVTFYDAAIASRFTTVPTFVGAALFDPVVPPPGQFSVFNELTCVKELFVRRAAHFEWPGMVDEERKIRRVLQKWFGERVSRGAS